MDILKNKILIISIIILILVILIFPFIKNFDDPCNQKVKGIGNCFGYPCGYEFDRSNNKCIRKCASGCSVKSPFKSLEECQKVCES